MATSEQAGLPVRAALHADGLYLALQQIAASELRDPFMQQTIRRATAPLAVVCIERRHVGREPKSAPAGLILHVGRCGSTLLSQLLKQRGGVAAYGEPMPLNELLALPHKWPRDELIGALRSLGAAFSRHAGTPYVLKCSSWMTLFADLLTEAFPETPWVFSIRDPAEVGVSYMNDTPKWFWGSSEQAREFAQLVDPMRLAQSKEDYFARLYGAYCESVMRLNAARGKLIDYDTLPGVVWEIVAPHFSLSIDASQQQAMREAARLHAKAPASAPRAFVEDSASKQAAASDDLRRAVDAMARPALERLRAHFASPP